MVVESFDAARKPKFATQIAELTQALETMFDRIAAGEDILEQLDRINVLHREVAPTAPKMLCHYLERKSYTKALDLLKTL